MENCGRAQSAGLREILDVSKTMGCMMRETAMGSFCIVRGVFFRDNKVAIKCRVGREKSSTAQKKHCIQEKDRNEKQQRQ